jgi:hypothetical protein
MPHSIARRVYSAVGCEHSSMCNRPDTLPGIRAGALFETVTAGFS